MAFPASPSTATTCSRSGQSMREAVARARRGEGPTLIEAKTYRTVGHHEGDPVIGTYRTQAEVDAWAKRDPVATFRRRLVEEFATVAESELAAIEQRDRRQSSRTRSTSPGTRRSPIRRRSGAMSSPSRSIRRRRSPPHRHGGRPSRPAGSTRCATASPRRCGAIRTSSISAKAPASAAAPSRTPRASGRSSAAQRMVDTPISEQGFTGAAIGASATGARTIADLMFADFMFEAAGQIVLQAAKLRYMTNGQMNAPMVVRVGSGALRSAGPHHSGAYHPMWAHVPGLIVCMPSTPGRRQGPDEDRAARRRPRDHAGDEGAVRHQGRGAGRRALRAVRRRPHRARRDAT